VIIGVVGGNFGGNEDFLKWEKRKVEFGPQVNASKGGEDRVINSGAKRKGWGFQKKNEKKVPLNKSKELHNRK